MRRIQSRASQLGSERLTRGYVAWALSLTAGDEKRSLEMIVDRHVNSLQDNYPERLSQSPRRRDLQY